MYAAIFLFALAQGLLLQNWLAGWAGLVTVALLYLVRTPREEKMMCESSAILSRLHEADRAIVSNGYRCERASKEQGAGSVKTAQRQK